jgi:hypothetical protein
MTKPHFARLVLASSIALALAACGGSDDHDNAAPSMPETPTMSVGDVFALTASNRLVSFNRDTPCHRPHQCRRSAACSSVKTWSASTSARRRHAVRTRQHRPPVHDQHRHRRRDVKSTLSADASDTTAPFTALAGTDFGFDFNPVADRLRVVSNTGLSLRINVDTGATTTDGAINGGAANTAITASAYTNSFAGTSATTLYGIDSVNSTLYVQNPPNDGKLATPVTLGVNAGGANGFDIDARTNVGYLLANVGGARNLYSVNLGATANAATLVGAIGVNEDIRGLALRAQAPTVLGLRDDNRLLAFKVATPNTIDTNVAITGLNGGETLLGIDVRPKDGLLYGLTSAARLVTIDPATGAATVKATLERRRRRHHVRPIRPSRAAPSRSTSTRWPTACA